MARTMTSVAVGQVNRRLLLLAFVLAALSAVLVYAAISRSDGGGSTAGAVSVVVAKNPIAAGTTITAAMLEAKEVPESAVGFQALTSIDAAVGKVARYPLAANEQVLLSKVVGPSVALSQDVVSSILQEGTRALAIQTSAVVGAGGLVLPGDHVDILWVPKEFESNDQGAVLLAENVEVVAVQQTLVQLAPPAAPAAPGADEQPAPQTASGERVRSSEADPIPEATTVTLMVTPGQAQIIFCAEQQGALRLAVRAFGDAGTRGVGPVRCPAERNEQL